MLFLPKKAERYSAALRNHLQNQILRSGDTEKLLPALRKILLFDACRSSEAAVPTDVTDLSDSLLGAAFLVLLGRGCHFTTHFWGSGVYLVPRGVFSLLLTELVRSAAANGKAEITVRCTSDAVRLTAIGAPPSATVRRLADQLHAVCCYVARDHVTVISVPVQKTAVRPEKAPDEWQYLLNPLSVVNAVLSPLPKM